MYKYHLSDVEWREFFIGGEEGIFDIKDALEELKKVDNNAAKWWISKNTEEYGVYLSAEAVKINKKTS